MEVVSGAFVQVENHVEVGLHDFAERLVEQGENLFIGRIVFALEQVEIVHGQAHVVEPRLSDALEVAFAEEGLYVRNNPGETDGVFFLDAVDLTEPATQIHSAQSFLFHCVVPVRRK